MAKKKGLINTVVIIAIVIVAIGLIGVVGFRQIEKGMSDLLEMPIMDIDFSSVWDGSYPGEFNRFPVSAEVEVTVQGERVTGIELLSHRHGPGYSAGEILDRVIEHQSLNVDVISGATYSSIVILKAIEDALMEARQ